MPRWLFVGDSCRHLLPLPPVMRAQQPFLLDARHPARVIAPWRRKKCPLFDEAERLAAVFEWWRDLVEPLPPLVFWVQIGMVPEPVRGAGPDWLRHWARDRAVYKLAA